METQHGKKHSDQGGLTYERAMDRLADKVAKLPPDRRDALIRDILQPEPDSEGKEQ